MLDRDLALAELNEDHEGRNEEKREDIERELERPLDEVIGAMIAAPYYFLAVAAARLPSLRMMYSPLYLMPLPP